MISGIVAQETLDSSAVEEIVSDKENIEVIEDIVEEEKISEEELLNMAIRKDIETSTLDELYYWAESLSLKSSKNEQSLKNILYNHYGLKPAIKSNKKEGSVKIEQAEYSTYYTVEDVDENIAEFEGRVKVIIVDDNGDTDKNNDKIHTVIADKINFNRTENSFSAIGNVEYVTQSPGVPSENIKGDSMTFNLDNWRGSILKCISEQEKEVDKEKQTFYYVTGEIKKSSTEVMGMDDVYIQTVEGSPYFNVSSTDMWMLNASDYLIFSPFVRIGHVPVLWVPFYYHTENSLYFNPLYGYDNRKGTIFNNTVYLIGKKPKKEEDTQFSFLAYNMKETTNYDMNNMTLVPNEDNTVYSDEYLKFMFDYYSKLGLYIGNSGNLNFFKDDLSVKLDSGIAFSRNVDTGNPFDVVTGESSWDQSYFVTTQVPFRYLFELSLKTNYVDLEYKTYSDIYFKSDFYDRGENFLWVNYFTDKLDDGVEGIIAGEDDNANYNRDTDRSISSYTWGIDIKKDLKLSPEILKPFLKSTSISFDKFTISFNSKIFQKYKTDSEGEIKYGNDGKPEIEQDKTHDLHSLIPGDKFFYPESILVPLKGSISGSFYDTSFTRSVNKDEDEAEDKDIKKEKKDIDPLFKLDSPFIEKEDDKENIENLKEERDLFELDPVAQKSNLSISSTKKGFITSSLNYTLQSPLKLKLNFDDEPFNPDDIEYEYRDENLLIDVVPQADLKLNFKTNNNIFSLNDTLSGKQFYKQYLAVDDQDDLYNNYRYQSVEVKNSLSANLKPLEFLSGNQHTIDINYLLNNKVYEKKFKKMDEEDPDKPIYNEVFPEWNDEIITSHSIKSSYTLKYPIITTSVTHSKTLEPLEVKDEINTSLKLNFWDVSTSLNWNLNYDEKLIVTKQDVLLQQEEYEAEGKEIPESKKLEEADAWEFKDITGSITYKPIDDLSFVLSGTYNPEEYELEKMDGNITWHGLKVKLNSKFDNKYEWVTEGTGEAKVGRWVKDDTDENGNKIDKALFLDNINISHSYSLPKTYFWKNRIDMNVKTDFGFTKYLNKVTDSKLYFNLDYSVNIFKFLSLSIKTKSENNSMFLYFPDDRDEIGLDDSVLDDSGIKYNILEDLIRSFNIFNQEDRENSRFNLKSLNISLNYKTPDWDFIVSYDAYPKSNPEQNRYEWYPVYSFFVEWKPLKMVQTRVENEDERWSATTSPKEN